MILELKALFRLASLGHYVVGVEYVEDAVRQFFEEQKIKYQVTKVDEFQLFTVTLNLYFSKLNPTIFLLLFQSEDGHVKIYQGDFYKFKP